MSTRDLGSVTSYAMAVALGFEGTEAEWVTYMMEAGDNAASAAASAASASASATSAEASAETARINYGSPLAASTLSAMTEQNRVYVYTGVEQGMTYGDWYYYDGSGWVDGGIYNATAEGQGLTDNERALILTLFSKAAYAEDDAGDAYDQLSALWSVYSVTWSGTGYTHGNTSVSARGGSTFVSTVTASGGHTISTVVATMGGVTVQGAWNNGTVTIPNVTGDIVITVTTAQAPISSISAVYTQSGTVYDTDSLDSLKSDLVVTATYESGTTGVVSDDEYTLSGTLTAGTSTITISCGGKTTTFNVTVTHVTQIYSVTNSLTNCTNSNNSSRIGEGESYTATLTATSGYILTTVVITMGGDDVTSEVYSNGSIDIDEVTGAITIYAVALEMTVITTNWTRGNLGNTGNVNTQKWYGAYVSDMITMGANQTLVVYNTDPNWTTNYTGSDGGGKTGNSSGCVFFQNADSPSYIYPGISVTDEKTILTFSSDSSKVSNYSKTIGAKIQVSNLVDYLSTVVVGLVDGVV